MSDEYFYENNLPMMSSYLSSVKSIARRISAFDAEEKKLEQELIGKTRVLGVIGVTLSASHQTETWDPEAKAEYHPRSNKLLIRQALLGPDAKPDELNVVQVETMSLQEAIKIPVAVLKAGETRHARLDIEFPDAPVTFTLIQGSGPVHLIGQHLLGAMVEEFEDMEEMEEEMLDEEEGDDSQFKEDKNKRKTSAGKRKPNEDEDDEEGEPKGKKAKMSNNAKGKAPSPKKNAKK